MANNYPLAPAPVVKRTPRQIDLGAYDDTYTGWIVVVNPSIPLSLNDTMAQMAADSLASEAEKLAAMQTWIRAAFLAWNFVDDEGVPLAQPREGGARQVAWSMIELLSKAFVEALKPSDPSSPQ